MLKRMKSKFLKIALDLAKKRKGYCAPNPAVGAVVVKNHQIIATGFHWGAGHPHAEIEALALLNHDQSQGADLYVTLEPCCHHGKTPPCTHAIQKSGIARVFYGFTDPDPRVAGQGAAWLTAAGIPCKQHLLPEITEFYQSYRYWQITKRPRVSAKLALSLDGKIAGIQGERIKISGTQADRLTHQQRNFADALLTTARTICQDDPYLTVRLPEIILQKPIYVLDSRLSIPLMSQVFTTAKPLILLHSDEVSMERVNCYRDKGAICIKVAQAKNTTDLCWNTILEELGKAGIQDVWVEAGRRCFESLIDNHQLHQAYLYVAACYVGSDGLAAFTAKHNLLAEVKKIQWEILGKDAICHLVWEW